MLEINFIREEQAKVIAGLKKKGAKNVEETVTQVLELDEERKKTQRTLNEKQAQAKDLAKQIGGLMQQGKKEEAEQTKAQTASLKSETKSLNESLHELENSIQTLLYNLPNVPHPSVPEGRNEEDNQTVFEHGNAPSLPKNAQPHWELIKKHDIIDFDLGSKITGAGFPVYKGKGARLQRAMIAFFLDEAEKAGYIEVQPPLVVNEASGYATGQLPDKEGQMYSVTGDLYLIPTAEVPITNLYRDVMLEEKQLPIKHMGYTPCFRREAGSWGANVRGLNRLHQFDKVEIVHIEKQENSYQALEEMKKHVGNLLEKLGLQYRILRLCGGDLGFTSALTYDFEVFSAAQQKWLEVSSVSNFETYQANRLKLRYKTTDKKKFLAHTLNGSALALPRILAAILENNQTETSIQIPEVLQSYCGFSVID